MVLFITIANVYTICTYDGPRFMNFDGVIRAKANRSTVRGRKIRGPNNPTAEGYSEDRKDGKFDMKWEGKVKT